MDRLPSCRHDRRGWLILGVLVLSSLGVGCRSGDAVDSVPTTASSVAGSFPTWLATDGRDAYDAAMITLFGPCDPPWRSPGRAVDIVCRGGLGETLQAGGAPAVLTALPDVEASWAHLTRVAGSNDDGSEFARGAIEAFRSCRDASAALLVSLSDEATAASTPWLDTLDPMTPCLSAVRAVDEGLLEITAAGG